jgi:hypothetical protein
MLIRIQKYKGCQYHKIAKSGFMKITEEKLEEIRDGKTMIFYVRVYDLSH